MAHTTETRATALRKMNERRKAWLAANGPCVKCQSAVRLEVHHIDLAEKISHRVWSWSEPRRTAELVKCEVLCRRCHVQAHTVAHGRGGYDRGCRCDVCRAAKAAHAAAYRSRHLERVRARGRAWKASRHMSYQG